MPSVMTVDTHTLIREDLPTDLIISMKIQKLTPFPMTVPCLNGIGSCEYEICPMIVNDPDTWCTAFPDSALWVPAVSWGDESCRNGSTSAGHGIHPRSPYGGRLQRYGDFLWSL